MLETKVQELNQRLQSYDKTLSVIIDRKRYEQEGPTLTIVQKSKGLCMNLRFGISPFLSNDVIVKNLLMADMYRVRSIYQSLKFGDQYKDEREREEDEARLENTIRSLENIARQTKYYF
jgi:hypothetical protein